MVAHRHVEAQPLTTARVKRRLTNGRAVAENAPLMKPLRSLAVSLLLIVATICNSGCANTADGRKTQGQGAGIGAVGGAVIGALIGVASGDRRNIGTYAAAGAVAGGVAGFAYGTMVAKRKARYARAEQWLDQEIALAHRANTRAYAYNSSLKSRIASLQARANSARTARNKSGARAVKSEIAQLQKAASQQARSETQTESDVKAVLGDKEARSADNYSSYQREANAFHKAKAERGELLGRLASLDNSLDR